MSSNLSSVKLRTQEKEKLVADLKQQLADLKTQNRDYKGVNEEIAAIEQRFNQLTEERANAEREHKKRIQTAQDDVAAARRQLDELKFSLQEK